MLVMDFSKAFKKVGHELLHLKLAVIPDHGITVKTNSWIRAILSHRTQVVVVDGERSSKALFTSGVPQGAVLGPCMLLLFINNLSEELYSSVHLFVDDTIAFLTVDSEGDACKVLGDLGKLD